MAYDPTLPVMVLEILPVPELLPDSEALPEADGVGFSHTDHAGTLTIDDFVEILEGSDAPVELSALLPEPKVEEIV